MRQGIVRSIHRAREAICTPSSQRLRIILLICLALGVMATALVVLVPRLLSHRLPQALGAVTSPTAGLSSPTAHASLPQSVSAEVTVAQFIGPHDAQTTIPFTILLQPNNLAGLDALVQAQYDPTSAHYHHWLQPGAFSHEYGPTATQMQAVMAFLGQYHVHSDQSSGGLVVTGTGLTADLEAAFRTPINDYQLDGTPFFANSADIQIPATLESAVAGVSINSLPVMASQMATTPLNDDTYTTYNNYDPCAQNDCLDPSAIRTVYDANPAYSIHDQGQGQTLALVEFSRYTESDIEVYEQRYGLPNVPISNVVLNVPSTTFDHRHASEVEMDIELAIALAPGLQRILVYQAPNTDAADVVMYDRIAADDAAEEVSTSWGDCEANQPTWIATTEYYAFVQMAAQGQTALAASGDTGAFSCLGDKQLAKLSMPKALQALAPASQPWVTAVGGTSLAGAGAAIAQGYPVGHEHSWNDDCAFSTCPGSGGGGVSRLWPMSDIGVQSGAGVMENGFSQSGAWCAATAGSFCREVPDVSINADIYSPYWVYCGDRGDSGCGGWIIAGGTSAAAPLWAAIVALMRQHEEFAGGLLTPVLYSFDSTRGYCYQLHDITHGTNGYYPAGPGYDMATGLGSPDIWFLVEQHQVGSGCPHGGQGGPTPTPPTPTVTPAPQPITPTPQPQAVKAYDNYGTSNWVGHAMCRGNPSNSLSMPGGTAAQTFTVPSGVATLSSALVQIDPDSTVTAHLSVVVNGNLAATTTALAAGDTRFAFGPVSVRPGDTVTISITFTATYGKIITVYTVGSPGGTFTASNSCPDGAPNVSTTGTGLRAVVAGLS